MIIVNNQPVNFETDPFNNPYVEEIKYKQLVQQGDITQFQFQTLSSYDGRNLLTNPTFQLNLDGWYQMAPNLFEWNDGVLYYGKQGSARLATTIQQDVLTVNTKYELRVNVNRATNGYFEFWFGTNKVAQKSAGVHTISGVCETTNQFKIKFIPLVPRTLDPNAVYTISVGSIDYAFISESTTSNHIFPIIDVEDDTVVSTLKSIDDSLSDPYTPSSDAVFYETSLTMNLDWQTKAIANGCYRIGVCDADINTNLQCGTRNSELVGGQNFSDGTSNMPNWTLNQNGTADHIVGNGNILMGGNGDATISQYNLKIGTTYNYAFNISSISGTPTITVYMGNGSTDAYTTAGVKTGQLICAGNTTLYIEVTGASASDYAIIEYVRIEAIPADLEPDYYSNPFYLATSHHRTVVANCNNTENVFGLTYENTLFSPMLRLRGYVAPDDNAYQTEREQSETTFGRRDVYYFKRRKSQLLIIENEPEFVHDWLSLLAGHDHAMVDNLEYFITDDDYPPIKWDKYRVLGNTQLPMQEKQQLDRKVVFGAVKTAQFIQDNDGDGVVGGFLTGEEILNDDGDFLANPLDRTIRLQTPISRTLDELSPIN